MNNDERILQILDRSACLSSGQMMAYVKGTLVPEELRAVELHLAECSLCNDAIEGFNNKDQPEELIKQLAPPTLPDPEPEKKAPAAAPAPKTAVPTAAETRNSAAATRGRSERIRKRRKNPLSGAIGIAALLLAGIFAIWFFEIRKGGTGSERTLAEERGSRLSNDSLAVSAQEPPAISAVDAQEASSVAAIQPSANDTMSAQTAGVIDTAAGQSPPTSLAAVLHNDSSSAEGQSGTALAVERAKKDSGRSVGKAIAAAAPKKEKSPVASDKAAAAKTTSKTKTTEKVPDTAPHSDFETGVALYKKKEYASALLYLNTVTDDKDHPRYWDGLYYSALCNLALGKEGRAKRYLRRVARSSAAVKNAAAQKLEALEKD